MSVQSSSALYRIWAQLQTSLNVVPNTTGTWLTTGAKYVPFNKLSITRVDPFVSAKYKTGTGSAQKGIAGGKRYGIVDSAEFPLMPSGTAGTAPMHDAILQGIFGGAPVTVASTSVTYGFIDGAGIPFLLGNFNEASGGANTSQFAYGVVPKTFSIQIGGNGEAVVSFDGVSFYVLETENWANEDAIGQGGLTVAYPVEPGSPAVTGNMVPGYAQTFTIGGTSVPEFRSMTIKGSGLRDLRMDGLGSYPDSNGVVQGSRQVSISSLSFADSSGAALIAAKNAGQSKTPQTLVVTQGNVAGYIVTHTVKGVQFANAKYSEDGSGGVNVQFDDSPAHASALTAVDEYTIALT